MDTGHPIAPQDALGAWIRDPDGTAPPPGIEPRRLRVYADLFYRNVESLVASAFPVIRATLGDVRWHALVRDFLREHPARTPLFPELAREMLRYLEARTAGGRADPPWLLELAHYEWVELALQLSDARDTGSAFDPTGDLLADAPVPSPLAWPLAYAWPVHRIGPDSVPDAPDPQPTLLLLRRAPDGAVRFNALSPLTFRLLQRIEDRPHDSGAEHLRALAEEAGAANPAAFLADGARMLEQLRADGTLLGTRPAGTPPHGS